MRLNKVEKVYIEARRSLDTPKQIAKDLHLLVTDVEKYIAKLSEEDRAKATTFVENTAPPPVAPPPAPEPAFSPPKVIDLVTNRTADKKRRGVAIMTQGGAELADETRIGRIKTRYGSDSIFVINPKRKD